MNVWQNKYIYTLIIFHQNSGNLQEPLSTNLSGFYEIKCDSYVNSWVQ
jgi:hypothetical protein